MYRWIDGEVQCDDAIAALLRSVNMFVITALGIGETVPNAEVATCDINCCGIALPDGKVERGDAVATIRHGEVLLVDAAVCVSLAVPSVWFATLDAE